ncbi:MAG: hypothetical protein OXC57_01230 [Rhodobacteraceae bacterium]|nr:hypothetical protein [Paracoccaceae bacterium]
MQIHYQTHLSKTEYVSTKAWTDAILVQRVLRLKATAGSSALSRDLWSNCRSGGNLGRNTAIPDTRQSPGLRRRCLTGSGTCSKTLPAVDGRPGREKCRRKRIVAGCHPGHDW